VRLAITRIPTRRDAREPTRHRDETTILVSLSSERDRDHQIRELEHRHFIAIQ
jgi:hypothetical protein